MDRQTINKLIIEEIRKTQLPNFVSNVNSVFNLGLWKKVSSNLNLVCNPDNKEMLKIDFTLSQPGSHGYHVPRVFIEVEDKYDVDNEELHELCKLAATTAPHKIFVTRYNGSWSTDRNNRIVSPFDTTILYRYSSMLNDYAEIQGADFNPSIQLIVLENNENRVSIHFEIWDAQKGTFLSENVVQI